MAEPHVLTGLIAKRAEIAGQIEHTQDKLRQLVSAETGATDAAQRASAEGVPVNEELQQEAHEPPVPSNGKDE